jgi:tRNA (guanosine-2'-O-)-methyltransferase
LTEVQWFSQFVTQNKKEKIAQVLENRTRRLTLVLEDIFQPHNASATLRTSEILGIQDIHIIENSNPYNINPDVVWGQRSG